MIPQLDRVAAPDPIRDHANGLARCQAMDLRLAICEGWSCNPEEASST